MDKRELDIRRTQATEHVRSSFFSLNVLVDTFIELSRRYPDDQALRDAIQALRYLSFELFDRITVMKLWDLVNDDDTPKA